MIEQTSQRSIERSKHSAKCRRGRFSGIVAVLLSLFATASLTAQVDLLPIDHPATDLLRRLHRYGSGEHPAIEHLPMSRRTAYEHFRRASLDTLLPESLREDARWFARELAGDIGLASRGVVIPTASDNALLFDSITADRPFTGVAYTDTSLRSRVALDPVLDAELRYDPDRSATAIIAQGGVRLRGSLVDRFGFSAVATNGTVAGDDTVVRQDPRYARSFKFGQLGVNRDVDFGSGHARLDFELASVEIGRERVMLGHGGERTLLFGAPMPSHTDYLRLNAHVGPFDYSHIHTALLADPVGAVAGIAAAIPPKYLVAHLVSIGPFAGLRFSVGEALIYSGRSFEIGYLNPFNFLKAQEHYLRDRDNSLMYAAMTATIVDGLQVEGEFMLDDLVFSNIGKGYWGNKTAWRLAARTTAVPLDILDLEISYTRLEPYVYSHFATSNSYLHDGAMLAASGLDPNSHQVEAIAVVSATPRLRGELSVAFSEHGANESDSTGVTRNVGGDVRRGFDSLSTWGVTFLDGDLETSIGVTASVRYEIIRNVYLRARGLFRESESASGSTQTISQIWFGLHIGAY